MEKVLAASMTVELRSPGSTLRLGWYGGDPSVILALAEPRLDPQGTLAMPSN